MAGNVMLWPPGSKQTTPSSMRKALRLPVAAGKCQGLNLQFKTADGSPKQRSKAKRLRCLRPRGMRSPLCGVLRLL